MLNPWLAVALNIVPLGAGYLYAGRYRRFGVTLILGIVSAIAGLLILVAMFYPFGLGTAPSNGFVALALALGALPLVALSAYTSWDALTIVEDENAIAQRQHETK